MSLDLSKLSDEELKSIASGDLKNLPEQTLRLISGATPPAKSVPPVGIAGAPAIEAEMSSEFKEKKEDLKKDYEKEKEEITTTSPFTLPGFLTSPPALVTGGALLGAATLYAAPKIYKSVKERFMSKAPEAPVRIDPIGFESFADMTPATTLDANPLGQTNMTLEDIERLRAAQQKPPETPPAPGPIARTPLPTGAVNPKLFSSSPKAPVPPVQPPMTPFTPDELAAVFRGESVGAPISAAPAGAPAPTPSAGPNSSTTTAVVNEVKDMIQQTPDSTQSQELRTGTGKPAFAGQGPGVTFTKKGNPRFKPEYGSLAEVPTGYAFVPGGQNMDTLRQILGQAPYTEEFKKRNFPQTNELAIQEATAINRAMNRPTRAEMIAAGMTPAPNTPGITQATSKGTKPTTVRGLGIGALVAIPDLVKAQTPSEFAMAGAGLLESVLPPGFAMSGAGEGSTLSPQIVAQQKAYMDNLYRLGGGPLANTEAGERFRRNEEMTRRIAGRTGAAVPPQYRR